MAGDWIRLHRKALDSKVFADDWLWRLWSWCLMKACWNQGWRNGRSILPGQFVCGRSSAAQELGVDSSKWYRGMQILQSWGQIELETNSLGTLVTICNWAVYQNDQPAKRTASEQRVNSQRTADEQRVNSGSSMSREEEGKEGKENPPNPPPGGLRVQRQPFVPPTVEEVAAYCRERANAVDPQTFVDFYTGKGWLVGKSPMKDWRACVRTWEKGRNLSNGHHGSGLFAGMAKFLSEEETPDDSR